MFSSLLIAFTFGNNLLVRLWTQLVRRLKAHPIRVVNTKLLLRKTRLTFQFEYQRENHLGHCVYYCLSCSKDLSHIFSHKGTKVRFAIALWIISPRFAIKRCMTDTWLLSGGHVRGFSEVAQSHKWTFKLHASFKEGLVRVQGSRLYAFYNWSLLFETIFLQINNLLTSKDTREVTVVVKGVAITKYPIYRELQVFDFDRFGKTASLAEGLMNESEPLKPVHVNFFIYFSLS